MNEVADALAALDERIAQREECRRFYRGDQGTHLATPEMRRALKGNSGFSINFCRPIVDSLTDRVQLRSVTAVDGGENRRIDSEAEIEDSSEATDLLTAIWERSDLDITALCWQYATDGDAYLAVEVGDDGLSRVTSLDPDMVAPMGDGRMFVRTGDDTGAMIEGGIVTAYHKNPVGDWMPVMEAADDGTVGLVQTAVADAGGTPVTSILERIRNGSGGGAWGMSDLSTAIPQQRAINARAVDLHEVAGNAAWPQRWIVGQGATKAAGRLISRAGAIHGIEGESLDLKEFSAANPGGIVDAITQAVEHLSVTAGTPLQSNGVGAGASGEARRIAQDKLTRRAMKAAQAIGTALRRLLETAMMIEHGQDVEVAVEWESPEPIAERDTLETAMMKLSLGVSRHTILTEMGYDADREALLRADEKAEEQVSLTRAITTGTDTATDIKGLLGGAA